MTEYQTRATDPYYLRKVRAGLITPQDPTLEEHDENEHIVQHAFVEMLNGMADSRRWWRPYDVGYLGVDSKLFFKYLRVIDKRYPQVVERQRDPENRKHNLIFVHRRLPLSAVEGPDK